MKQFLLLVFISIGIHACSNLNKKHESIEFNNEYWLLGTWMYISGNDTIIEKWTYSNAKLNGVNSKLKKGDSIPNETISIGLIDGKYVYEAKVNNQNSGEGVPFILENNQDNKFVFANHAHDFPQYISYELTHYDSCTAIIGGNINNKKREIIFSLVRLPN